MDFLRQPLLGSDIAAFVFAVLALLFVVLWWRDREPGMSWLAAAYGVLAVQYFWDASTLPVDARVNRTTSIMLGVGAAAFNCGMVQYVSAPGRVNRMMLVIAVGLPLLLPMAAALDIDVYRPWSHIPYAISLLALVQTAVAAARREPRAGFEWIAAGLLSIPIFASAVVLRTGDSFYVRYYVLLPAIFFGILLLTVSLLRRSYVVVEENKRRHEAERALTALNASLEETIAQRTADLQNIVAGLESFNRNVSHDLRGSLSGMSGLAHAANEALKNNDTSVARRVLPLIANQAEQSSELVYALLTLARVGDHDMKKAQVDLNKLTEEVIASAALIKPASAMPRFIVSTLPPVYADASLLRPALTNLIGNAVKFCGYRPDACVEVLAEADDRETIVQVRDNGIGFAHDQAATLFEPFKRLHGPDFVGHGVGLSIVRRAVERQGGRVWAEAAPNKGASFYFSLPNPASTDSTDSTEFARAAD